MSRKLFWCTVGSIDTKKLTKTSSALALYNVRQNHQPRQAVKYLQCHFRTLSGEKYVTYFAVSVKKRM